METRKRTPMQGAIQGPLHLYCADEVRRRGMRPSQGEALCEGGSGSQVQLHGED